MPGGGVLYPARRVTATADPGDRGAWSVERGMWGKTIVTCDADGLAFEPGPALRKHGPAQGVAPAENHLAEMGQPHLLCAIEQVALTRSPRASEPVHPRERGGTDSAVSELSRLCGVCHCQVRVYDKEAGDSAWPSTAHKTSKPLLISTKRSSSTGEVDLVEADVGTTKWVAPAARTEVVPHAPRSMLHASEGSRRCKIRQVVVILGLRWKRLALLLGPGRKI